MEQVKGGRVAGVKKNGGGVNREGGQESKK